MSDFATFAKKINEALVNPSIKFVCRSIAALVTSGMADDFLMSLGKQLENRPLTAKQIEAAVKVLRKKVGPLAKLAVAASTGKAPAAPLTAATPTPAPEPTKPSALPPRGQKRPPRAKQPKEPKLPKPAPAPRTEPAGPFYTPDVDGMAPWEAHDREAA